MRGRFVAKADTEAVRKVECKARWKHVIFGSALKAVGGSHWISNILLLGGG